ncbi:HalOD1 output domain-containing protein [Natrinema salaciae]
MPSRQAVYEPETDGTPVTAIVRVLKDATPTDSATLPPLFDSIDPEAVNALYSDDDRTEYPRLTFTHDRFLVTIDRTRRITVREIR